MTRQQYAYAELRIYRLRIDDCLCLSTRRTYPLVTIGAMRSMTADRGRMLMQYLVCLN